MSTGPHPDFASAVRDALAARANPERAAGQQRYMKSALPYHGLTSPELAVALRPILRDPGLAMRSRDEWATTIREVWEEATHREEWYAALALAKHRAYRHWVDSASMPLWERLIRTGAWWDVVDDIATHLVRDAVLAAPHVEKPRMRSWAVVGDSLWVRRAAMLCQVGVQDRLDQQLLTDVIEPNVEDPDFFSRKAIGWALRDHARWNPAWVCRFVEEHPNLSGLSRREALKHVGPAS